MKVSMFQKSIIIFEDMLRIQIEYAFFQIQEKH